MYMIISLKVRIFNIWYDHHTFPRWQHWSLLSDSSYSIENQHSSAIKSAFRLSVNEHANKPLTGTNPISRSDRDIFLPIKGFLKQMENSESTSAMNTSADGVIVAQSSTSFLVGFTKRLEINICKGVNVG